jgi:hypothetical protein
MVKISPHYSPLWRPTSPPPSTTIRSAAAPSSLSSSPTDRFLLSLTSAVCSIILPPPLITYVSLVNQVAIKSPTRFPPSLGYKSSSRACFLPPCSPPRHAVRSRQLRFAGVVPPSLTFGASRSCTTRVCRCSPPARSRLPPNSKLPAAVAHARRTASMLELRPPMTPRPTRSCWLHRGSDRVAGHVDFSQRSEPPC